MGDEPTGVSQPIRTTDSCSTTMETSLSSHLERPAGIARGWDREHPLAGSFHAKVVAHACPSTADVGWSAGAGDSGPARVGPRADRYAGHNGPGRARTCSGGDPPVDAGSTGDGDRAADGPPGRTVGATHRTRRAVRQPRRADNEGEARGC